MYMPRRTTIHAELLRSDLKAGDGRTGFNERDLAYPGATVGVTEHRHYRGDPFLQ